MPRSKKSAAKGDPSQGLVNTKSTIAEAKKKARALLKKAGTDVRAVRHDVAALKKSGLVSKRVNVRSYLPTKYMLKKIERNRDVLRGEMIAVPAPKTVREKYTKKGIFEQRGSTLIIPRDYVNQKTRISRGLVEISRDLRMGEEVRLILPFKAADMEGVARGLLSDPTLNGMKKPDELFGFRLFGHNMNTIGFPDVEEFANYILTNYAHLFSGKSGKEGVKHFEMFRFKSRNSQLTASPEEGRKYTPRPVDRRGNTKRDFVVNKRRERDAARKAKARAKETPGERQKRLDEQRRRQARLRQQKWEDQ